MPKPLTAKTAQALVSIVTDDLKRELERADAKPREYLIREALRGMAFERILIGLVGAIGGEAAELAMVEAINGPTPSAAPAGSGRFLRERAEDSQLNAYVTAGRQPRPPAATTPQGAQA